MAYEGASTRRRGPFIRLALHSMLIVVTSVFLVFWLRDYMSLRMSSSNRMIRRLVFYAVAMLLTATLISVAARMVGVTKFIRLGESSPTLFLLMGFHLVASASTLWVKRTERYNLMWITALIPAPIVWLFLLETRLISGDGMHFGLFAFAAIWAATMVVVVFRTRHTHMPLQDLDFAVDFGGLSHCLAICALPLAFLTP